MSALVCDYFFLLFFHALYIALAMGSRTQIATNQPGKCGIILILLSYISLNTAAKIQIAAIKIDTAIRNKEKLYSFSGLDLS